MKQSELKQKAFDLGRSDARKALTFRHSIPSTSQLRPWLVDYDKGWNLHRNDADRDWSDLERYPGDEIAAGTITLEEYVT